MAVQETGLGFVQYATTRNPFNYSKIEQINRDVSTQWLTMDEISDQINLYSDESQDPYLKSLELATRMAIEDYLGLPIMPVSYRIYYGASSLFGSPISLDLPEDSQGGVTIDAVKYYSDDDVPILTTVSNSNYYFDPTGSKVVVTNLPSNINSQMSNPVICEYTVAASPIGTYPVVKQAALLWFVDLYNNRSNTTDVNLKTIPRGIDTLLRPYKPLVM